MPLATDSNKFKGERYYPHTIDIANPGAGNPISYAVPDNRVYHIVGVYFAFTTSIIVGDRWPYISMQTGGVETMHVCPVAALQAEGLGPYSYYFSTGLPPVDMSAVLDLFVNPITCCMELTDADEFVVTTPNFDALDAIINCRIRVQDWTEN